MEVHINSNYLEGFISKYSKENSDKVVKYLAILGIHFLDTINKQNIALAELKSIAQNVIKAQPTEGKYINQELQVIKDELAKLSWRVAHKIGTAASQKVDVHEKHQTIKRQEEPLQQKATRTGNISDKFESRDLLHKPSTSGRDSEKRSSERRGTQLDNIQEATEITFDRDTSKSRDQRDQGKTRISPANRHIEVQEIVPLSNSKGDRPITPKPTKIEFSGPESREYKNTQTRHHLDDSEAKKSMKEEGIIYFPGREKEEKRQSATKEVGRNKTQGKSPLFGGRRPQLEEYYNAEWSDNLKPPLIPCVQSTKSPNFPRTKDELLSKMLSPTYSAQKDREHMKTFISNSAHKGEVKGSKIGQRSNQKIDSSSKKNRKSSNDKSKKEVKPIQTHTTYSTTYSTATPNYKNVESKIKDEVNYHKELAKQYKKMKQSIDYSENLEEGLVTGASSRFGSTREANREKFVSTEKEESRGVVVQNFFEENARYRNSRALESANSAHNTYFTTQQLSGHGAEKASSHKPKNRHNFEFGEKNEDGNHHHKGNSESRGGILDIANSFLNSPLMQHISNIDNPLKESTSRNLGASKGSNVLIGSLNGMSEIDEDMRLQSSAGLQQSRYSKGTNSILKDSTNRKYGDSVGKDLKGSSNGTSSLASSNFSNFLNEEMKGFYQKENLEVKKPKHPVTMVRFGSSENSSNVSFSGNEVVANAEKKGNFHKREYGDTPTGVKGTDGFSFDNANVFKNDRMSMAQLLNN